MRIGPIPLDERPFNTRYPVAIGQITGIDVRLPSCETLSALRTPARSDALTGWLHDISPRLDAPIVPLEMLGYGGLIASRKLAAYGGWNTAGNAVGVVLAQGCAARLAQAAERRAAQQRLLLRRFVEEWGYQTVVRPGSARLPWPFQMFAVSPEGNLPFWTYRRLVDGALLDPTGRLNDIALINWPGNDYHGANLIDKPAAIQAQILDEAKVDGSCA